MRNRLCIKPLTLVLAILVVASFSYGVQFVEAQGLAGPHILVRTSLQLREAREAADAKCANPIPEYGAWLVPNNVYRVYLTRPKFAGFREQPGDQLSQIAEFVTKAGNCYRIVNFAVTTASKMVDVPQGAPTQVWNDSLILVLERKR